MTSLGSTTWMSTRSSSRLRLLVLLLTVAVRAQESEHPLALGADWPAKVKIAIESPRYAVQRAASNEVARAGDAAVPAIRAYAEAKGKDAIPLLLVDALAQTDADGEALRALLRGWASDPAFFWRAQALTGLARRKSADDDALFAQALHDPAHLFRVAGAKGVFARAVADGKAWDAARAILQDQDPRARVAFALHVWGETRDRAALPTLVAAIADDRAFLDDEWGRRLAVQSVGALARVAATNFGYQATQSLAGNSAAIDKFAKWAELDPPPRHERDEVIDHGGVEVRSCRHGDLFLRWTDAEVHFDLDRGRKVTLPVEVHRDLMRRLTAALATNDEARRVVGEVVCDYVQITVRQPARVWKVAPGALPVEVHGFLSALADAVAAAGHQGVADDLRLRLAQFAARD